jgi:Site-specific DNA methylase
MDSFISWIGGKRLLRRKIISLFPSNGVEKYVEVFGGAAWVLFGTEQQSKTEIYNDINGELVNLFRCVKYHYGELQRELRFALNSREMFLNYRSQIQAEGLTDIQRAARYFMIIKLSYGSDRRTYGCTAKNISKMTDYLEKASERLAHVLIEHRTFEDILKAYDSPGTLFYLDPPYHGTEKYYDSEFSEDLHKKLCCLLQQIKGRFILSYNDDDFIRSLYSNFEIESITRNSNLTGRYKNTSHSYAELLIKNY